MLRCEVCAAVVDRGDGRPSPVLEADDTGHALDARDPRTRWLQVNRTPATPTWLCGGCLGELVDDGPGRRRCERTGCGAVFHTDDGRPVEDTA